MNWTSSSHVTGSDPARVTGILRRHILKSEGEWTAQLNLAIDDA